MLAGEAQEIMPPAGLAELHQRQSGQATIRDQRTLRLAQMRQDALEQAADNGPLPFLPGFLQRHDLPTDRQEPRMHQQPQIDNAGPVIQRRQIQDKDQAAILKEGQQVSQEAVPDGHHGHLRMSEEARQTAFDARGFGRADAEQFLGNQRQASLAGKHEAEDKEGEGFAAMACTSGRSWWTWADHWRAASEKMLSYGERSFP